MCGAGCTGCCWTRCRTPARSTGHGQSWTARTCGPKGGEQTGASPVDRSRLGSKHYLIVDGRGTPLAFTLTGGHRHDVTQLTELVDRVPPAGRHGTFRPRHLYADRAYDSKRHRSELRERGITPRIARQKPGTAPVSGKSAGCWSDLLAARPPLSRPPARPPRRHPRSHANPRLRPHLPQTSTQLSLGALRRAFGRDRRTPGAPGYLTQVRII